MDDGWMDSASTGIIQHLLAPCLFCHSARLVTQLDQLLAAHHERQRPTATAAEFVDLVHTMD